MNDMNKGYVYLLIAVLLAFALGYINGLNRRPEPEVVVRERTDTLTIVRTDTLVVTQFVPVEREVRDTLLVPVTEYEVVHDTTYIPLPREYVTYKDSSYRAVVSGFSPRLEELEMYPRTEYVTIQTEKVVSVKRNPRFSIGVQAGYGITPAGFQPYLGVGGQLNILSF